MIKISFTLSSTIVTHMCNDFCLWKKLEIFLHNKCKITFIFYYIKSKLFRFSGIAIETIWIIIKLYVNLVKINKFREGPYPSGPSIPPLMTTPLPIKIWTPFLYRTITCSYHFSTITTDYRECTNTTTMVSTNKSNFFNIITLY